MFNTKIGHYVYRAGYNTKHTYIKEINQRVREHWTLLIYQSLDKAFLKNSNNESVNIPVL